MGRNIDLDEMIVKEEAKCCKCGTINLREFEEFDMDCYEFKNGICYFNFECRNCTYTNKVRITIKVDNEDMGKVGEN